MATTYGERLKKALKYRGIPQRQFTKRIKPLVARGGSYRSLSNYLTNEFTPTQAWTQAASGILGVSETWLGADEGRMLPDEPPTETDPNFALCYGALDILEPGLSDTAHLGTVVHLMLARDQFEERYGETMGLSGKDAKKSYAEHLLLPLKQLLLHVRGSDEFEDLTPETVRRALNQYLELVLLLMPAHDAANEGARKGVGRCLLGWRKQKKAEADAALEAGVRIALKAKSKSEEKV